MGSFVPDFARLVVDYKREFKSYLYLLILWSEVQEWNIGWNQDILTFAVSSSDYEHLEYVYKGKGDIIDILVVNLTFFP